MLKLDRWLSQADNKFMVQNHESKEPIPFSVTFEGKADPERLPELIALLGEISTETKVSYQINPQEKDEAEDSPYSTPIEVDSGEKVEVVTRYNLQKFAEDTVKDPAAGPRVANALAHAARSNKAIGRKFFILTKKKEFVGIRTDMLGKLIEHISQEGIKGIGNVSTDLLTKLYDSIYSIPPEQAE